MKIENFENAEQIKKEIDAKKEQLYEVKNAIDNAREPETKTFDLVSYGRSLISWKVLNWEKMLADAQDNLNSEIKLLTRQFENLE